MLLAVRALLRRPALRHLLVALSIGSFGTYGLAQWLPTFYIRSYHLTLAEVGLRAGLAGGVGGVLGVLCGGFAAAHLQARDRRWELWWPALTYGGSAPFYLAVFFAPSAWAAIALQVLATFLAAAGGGVALSAIQSFAERDRRATAIALVLFLSSLLGLGAGPYAIGLLSDLLHPRFGDESLRYALVLSTAALIWAGAQFVWAARTARADRV